MRVLASRLARTICALIFGVFVSSAVWAVQPDEVLDDPALEARAREISAGLRCPVCQSENIDESNAVVARDLRLLVRERLLEGDTDEEVVAYVVDRFGEYVMLRPNADGANIALWLAAPAMLGMALFIGWTTIRRRSEVASGALTEEEKARLDEIMRS